MDAPNPLVLSRRVPFRTLLMIGGALAVALAPGWNSALIYDRSAILSGQFWRMWTGHWVHFSTRHLVCDVIPLGVAGCIVEARGWPRFGWFCVLAPWVISAATLIFEPQLKCCAGLSGLACAMVTLMALDGLIDASWWRYMCAAALLGLLGKILFDWNSGHCLFVTIQGIPVAVSVTSHMAGAATALFYAWSEKNSSQSWRLTSAGVEGMVARVECD